MVGITIIFILFMLHFQAQAKNNIQKTKAFPKMSYAKIERLQINATLIATANSTEDDKNGLFGHNE